MQRFKGLLRLVAFGAILFVTSRAYGESKRVELGGTRQVTADVSVVDEGYIIKVRLLPLRSFDDATNRELNRKKGRIYGLQALARHLSKDGTVRLTISGVQIQDDGKDGDFFTLTIRVPKNAVSVLKGERRATTEPKQRDEQQDERVTVDASLYGAKQEYASTIQELEALFFIRLQELEDRASKAKKEADAGKVLVNAVNKMRDEQMIRLDRMAKEIEKDQLLSDIGVFNAPSERSSILKMIETQKTVIRDHSSAAVEIHTREQQSESKASPERKK